MAVVKFQRGHAALIDVLTVLLAGVAAMLPVRFKVNAARLVLGGASAGWVFI
jgi:hypothetical protein